MFICGANNFDILNCQYVPGKKNARKSLIDLIIDDCSDEFILSFLKEYPTSVFDMDRNRLCALVWAIRKERTKIFIEMLKLEADVNSFDFDGYSPLHYAVESGNLVICQLLLRSGAEVNMFGGNFEWTPLHLACRSNRTDIVQLLISCGADRNAPDTLSKIPEDYLKEPFDALKECKKQHSDSHLSLSIHEVNQCPLFSSCSPSPALTPSGSGARFFPNGGPTRTRSLSGSGFGLTSSCKIEPLNVDPASRSVRGTSSKTAFYPNSSMETGNS